MYLNIDKVIAEADDKAARFSEIMKSLTGKISNTDPEVYFNLSDLIQRMTIVRAKYDLYLLILAAAEEAKKNGRTDKQFSETMTKALTRRALRSDDDWSGRGNDIRRIERDVILNMLNL